MMKKFILSSFILFLSFFGIKNVNAETLDFRDSDIRSFTYCRVDGTCEYDVSLPKEYYENANHLYYGAKMNSAHQLYQININRSHFNGINDGDSVSFYMYDNRSQFMRCGLYTPESNWIQQNSNSFLPLVTLNNYYCNVNLYGITGSSDNTCEYERRFYVTCPYYKNSSYDYDYIQSYYKDSSTSPAGSSEFFGITTMYVTRSNGTTLNDIEKGVNDLNDTISSSDTTESQSQANSFFDNFQTDTYGLSDVITMPLTLIKSLTNSTCVSLKLTIPFVNKNLELPCMSSIYSQYFGSFFTLYQTITFGFVAYWVVVRIFNLVKDFKNPDHDEIEVLDL